MRVFAYAVVFLGCVILHATEYANKVAYRLSGGRFGDNLIAYMHAKWVSYRYGIPLIYQDFPYANELMLEEYEEKMGSSHLQQKIFNQRGDLDAFIASSPRRTLYVIPYFPESSYDLMVDASFPYFRVDWSDPEFKRILKKMVAPKKELKKPQLPPGRISIALHVRRGPGFDGGFDSLITTKPSFPLKFPSEDFYIDALRRLYAVFEESPLYVHMFTDDIAPTLLLNHFKEQFRNCDILWNCRENGNHWKLNVLEDFFALTEFDCAIHGESNFSLCAGKIAHYQIEIVPETFHWEGQDSIIDSVTVHGQNKEIIAAYKAFNGE